MNFSKQPHLQGSYYSTGVAPVVAAADTAFWNAQVTNSQALKAKHGTALDAKVASGLVREALA